MRLLPALVLVPLFALAAVACGPSNPPARNANEVPGPDDQTFLVASSSGSDSVDGPMEPGKMR